MVLKITVKTLDSQNYEFEVDDTWSVQQFKDHIQPTVNAPTNEQRLIFCGRVLQDDKKLTDYGCNGKVIHLVRRPPPSLDNAGNTSAASASDSNNNDNGSNGVLDESNVLFSAMTLGPDANMNHILRHILTLQQAIYARNSGENAASVGGPLEPVSMSNIDRHLHNAARLLRITVNTINECMVRIAALPRTGARPQTDRSNLETPRPVLIAASSHTSLPSNDDTVDDINVGSVGDDSPRHVDRPNMPRQALTTDDLPQPVPTTLLRPQNTNGRAEGSRQAPLSLRRRGETDLDRYLTILNYSCDLQNQFQGLARRYRQLIDMSRLGGLIVPQASTSTSEASSTTTDSQRPNRQAGQTSSTLLEESRILGLYIPRILHHISHLQHALSDFSVDFARGRLLLCLPSNARTTRRHIARRSNPPSSEPQSNLSTVFNTAAGEPVRTRSFSRPEQTLEGSVTITATAIETSMRPQANATIVITSEPVQGGGAIRIPVPIPHGSISVDFSSAQIPQSNQSVAQSQQQPQRQQQQQQARAPSQATTSNSTQTATRPIGVISGRIPLPFDYFLPCFSPWANYNGSSALRLAAREGDAPNARVHLRQQTASTAQPSNANQNNTGAQVNIATQVTGQQATPAPDAGLAEMVTNLIGSIFRPPQADQSQPQTANENPATQDPLLNMIPELALNAATQILGGVLGTGSSNQGQQQQAERQQQTTTSSSSGTVMMDIDIDDSSSSQSESRYHDARESNSPAPANSNLSTAPMRASSSHQANLTSQFGHRQQLVEMMQSHPDWLPIIEADISVMEQTDHTSQPFFSDAYLSSIPRKRRRLLTASPDRVFILQPSPSQAISNLLRRAIISSSSPNIASLDQVLSTISNDSEVQAAYEDYIKSAVETRLKSDYDYCPEKFSNSSKYFK